MAIDLTRRLSHLDLAGIAGEASAITSGTLDLSMSEAPQLSIVLMDPARVIVNAPGSRLGAALAWGPLQFTISTVRHYGESGVPHTAITARSRGWKALKDRKGAKSWRGMSASQVVQSECAAAGLGCVAQPTNPKTSIARITDTGNKASTSDTELFTRLAEEEGFVFGEIGATVYFGAPSWLVKRTGWTVAANAPYLLDLPDMAQTSDDPEAPATVSLQVAGENPQEILLPFSTVQLTQAPARFAGRYLIDRISIPLAAAEPATVDLITPVDPEKQKP